LNLVRCSSNASQTYCHTADNSKGFTLIEIVVAMAVLSVTALAINTALVRHVDAAFRLEQKMIANWVASNAIAEARLAVKYEETPNTSGTEQMAGREWRFQLNESPTSDPYLISQTSKTR